MRSRSVPAFRRRGRRAFLVSLVAVAALAALFAPVEFPTSVRGVGRVLPAQEWVLARTPDGAITATLRDLRTGAVTTTYSAEPARGDAVRFELSPVAERGEVEAGETLGAFTSGEAALRLAALRGEIQTAEAALALSRAGARDEVVEAAAKRVRQAEAQHAQAVRLAARQRQLFENGLASAIDLEQAEGAVDVAAAAITAAQAERDAVAIGPLPESVEVAQAQVDRLRADAERLQERLEMDLITAPISGRIQRVFSPDTLLFVADASAYHVVLPVRWEDRHRVTPGRRVVLDTGDPEPPIARIVDVTPAAAPLRGQAYLVATAEVETGADRLVPGLQVPTAVETAPRTPLAHARDLFGW